MRGLASLVIFLQFYKRASWKILPKNFFTNESRGPRASSFAEARAQALPLFQQLVLGFEFDFEMCYLFQRKTKVLKIIIKQNFLAIYNLNL